MALTPTTPAAIIATMATRILAITPSHSEFAHAWDYKPDQSLEGAHMRSFDLIGGPEMNDPAGPIGGGELPYYFDLTVRTSYVGLTPEDARRIAGSDAADLWEHPTQGFHHAPGTVAGMYAPLTAPFSGAPYQVVPVDETRGEAMFDLIFRVHFIRTRAS